MIVGPKCGATLADPRAIGPNIPSKTIGPVSGSFSTASATASGAAHSGEGFSSRFFNLFKINPGRTESRQQPGPVRPNYRTLDAGRIIETTRTLSARIGERFPRSSLSGVAEELVREAEGSVKTARWLAEPVIPIRLMTGAGILALTASVGAMFPILNDKVELFSSISDFMQGLDAGVNGLILLGGAIYYLINRESHIKRERALKTIRELREMAHIIDMHQLTKDPERLSGSERDTASSPKRQMTPFELTRYLNYCSEMLAIISKIGAIYVQGFNDPAALTAVDEVQELTNGLSQKIWQKIMILDRIMRDAAAANGDLEGAEIRVEHMD